MIGIYKITNKQNGKVYIGQSNNIERRFSEHKQKRYETIDDYINILGVDNFDFEVIEECNIDELDNKEQLYIQQYQSNINGYNIQQGGYNNSQGEGNGRALLTIADVEFIRKSYQNHQSAKEIYNKYFKDKITKNQFQGVWQGRSWSYIMPEVFTLDNKQYYCSEQNKQNNILTKEEVLKYRQYYVNHNMKQTYQQLLLDKGNICTFRTFDKIIIGDVKENSLYKEIPIYKKKKKQWELNNEPVSTILESEE
jgi:group I intron endonuclease